MERYLDFLWQFILNFKGVTSVKQVTEKVFMDGTREKVKDQVEPHFLVFEENMYESSFSDV